MRLYTVKVVGLPVSLWTACLKAEGNLSLPFIPGYEKTCVAVCSGQECLSLKQSRSSLSNWHYDHFLGCLGTAFPGGPAFRPLGAEAPGAWRAFPAVPAPFPFQPAHWLCLRLRYGESQKDPQRPARGRYCPSSRALLRRRILT